MSIMLGFNRPVALLHHYILAVTLSFHLGKNLKKLYEKHPLQSLSVENQSKIVEVITRDLLEIIVSL